MADEANPDEGVIPKYSYNPVPTIYAEAIANVAHGAGVVKTYFVRFDPALTAGSALRPSLVAQLVMPTSGFLAVALFFEAQVKNMLASKEVTQEQIDEVRQSFANLAHVKP